MIVRRLIPILLLFFPIYSQVYYLEIYNPNSYDLVDYQLKINLTQFGIPIPIAKIETLNETNVPFCYEQPNGECNQTYSNTTEVIWIKVPYLPAKYYTYIKVIVNGTNGAVYGDRVFDFYDDFNDGILTAEVYNLINAQFSNPCSVQEQNGYLTVTGSDALCRIYYSNLSLPSRITIHSSVILDTYSSNTAFVLAQVHNTVEAWTIRTGATAWNIHTWAVCDTNGCTDSGVGIRQGIWYKVEFDVSETSKLFVNTNFIVSRNTRVASSWDWLTVILLGTDLNPHAARVDYIFVRKYADSDPIVRRTGFYDKLLLQYSLNPYKYQFTYLFVIPIRVTSNSQIGVTNLVIPISLNTRDLISQGVLKSDCSDISVTIYDPATDTEVNAKQYIDSATCNTENTIIYVNIPEYFVGRDIFINIYFGSPNAIPIQDPNTFYWFVDLSSPSDYIKIQIYTNGTVTYDVTADGMLINIGSGGKLVIYNK